MIESQRASRQAGSENMSLSWVFKGKTPKHREGLVPSRWGGGHSHRRQTSLGQETSPASDEPGALLKQKGLS